jgi:drug/metabolite transporter (DMT)-like permease
MGANDWALLVLLSVLWGGSFFFFKVIVEALPPFTVVLGRVGWRPSLLTCFCSPKAIECPQAAGSGVSFSPWAR